MPFCVADYPSSAKPLVYNASMDPFSPLDNVLLIDFDGVTHHIDEGDILLIDGEMRFEGTNLFQWLPIIEEIVLEHPTLMVAIHSSWRNSHTHEELAAFLPPGLRERFAGATFTRMSRFESIEAFVSDHQVKRHAILDDSQKEFPPGCPELILCDPALGVSDPAVAAKLRAWVASLPRPSPAIPKPAL